MRVLKTDLKWASSPVRSTWDRLSKISIVSQTNLKYHTKNLKTKKKVVKQNVEYFNFWRSQNEK